MRFTSPLALLLGSFTALAGVIDIPSTGGQLFEAIDHILHPDPATLADGLLEITENYHDLKSGKHRKLCTLHPRGEDKFDDDNLQKAVAECGRGGIIRLPDANYTIGSPLTITLHDATLDVHGWISFSTDIDHWVRNRVGFEFQNLALGWIIKGKNYILDGNDKGGIFGNGQAKDEGNKYGRPMSFAIVNSTNVVVKNWSVIQPQFWASIVINSTDVLYKDYYVNATQYDPGAKDHFLSWIQNTDGCDTYKSHNVTFENMVYQGGDDCLALKPNSSLITARNITCYGGTGIAFGSIGQYKNLKDYITDVHMSDIKLRPSSQHLMKNGLYFKSWMGYEIGEPPNGGGGGSGWAQNITVERVDMEKVIRPVYFETDLTYLSDHRREGKNTGLFHWRDIHITNITGTSALNRLVYMDCSKTTPCQDIYYKNFNVKPGKKDDPEIHYVCNNVIQDAANGLEICHASGSGHEAELPGDEVPPKPKQ